MLRTKCIVAQKSPKDGIRISVMSRHTLSDGKTIDPRITANLFDYHWPELAPPPKLVGAYYRQEISWEDFAIAYPLALAKPEAQAKLRDLIVIAKNQSVTVMCIERFSKQCHRRLLAQICRVIDPTLAILIR